MPTNWYQGKVIEVISLSSTTKQFSIEIMDLDQKFNFIPGQFITMDLPISEKRLGRWRSYSIASRPDDSNILELCIVRSEQGSGTSYLFEEIKIGSTIKFKGPDGGFTIPKDLDNEIIMLCTGTGVAPFRSMLHHLDRLNLDFHKIHLIFGTRNTESILYMDEFQNLANKRKNFIYDVALSREQHPDHHFGYIHDVYLKKYQDVNPQRQFYICGWSKMIDETVANLIVTLGYDKTQIHYELYG